MSTESETPQRRRMSMLISQFGGKAGALPPPPTQPVTTRNVAPVTAPGPVPTIAPPAPPQRPAPTISAATAPKPSTSAATLLPKVSSPVVISADFSPSPPSRARARSMRSEVPMPLRPSPVAPAKLPLTTTSVKIEGVPGVASKPASTNPLYSLKPVSRESTPQPTGTPPPAVDTSETTSELSLVARSKQFFAQLTQLQLAVLVASVLVLLVLILGVSIGVGIRRAQPTQSSVAAAMLNTNTGVAIVSADTLSSAGFAMVLSQSANTSTIVLTNATVTQVHASLASQVGLSVTGRRRALLTIGDVQSLQVISGSCGNLLSLPAGTGCRVVLYTDSTGAVQALVVLDATITWSPTSDLPALKRLGSTSWIGCLTYTTLRAVIASADVPALGLRTGANVVGTLTLQSGCQITTTLHSSITGDLTASAVSFVGAFPSTNTIADGQVKIWVPQSSLALSTSSGLSSSLLISSLVIDMAGLGVSPQIIMSCNASLAVSNFPPLAFALSGLYVNSSLQLSGLAPVWAHPFNANWLTLSGVSFAVQISGAASSMQFSALTTIALDGETISQLQTQGWYVNQALVVRLSGLQLSSLVGLACTLIPSSICDAVAEADFTPGQSYTMTVATAATTLPDGTAVRSGVSLISATGSVTGPLLAALSEVLPSHATQQLSVGFNFNVFPVSAYQTSAAFVQIPGFTVNSRVAITSMGVQALAFARPPSMQMFADLSVDVNNNGSPLLFHVFGGVNAIGIQLGGSMIGTWTNAFGLHGLDISNLYLSVGVSPGPVINSFGIAANISAGSALIQFAGQMSTNLASTYLFASVNRLSLTELVQLYNAIVPNNIDIPLNNVPSLVSFTGLSFTFAPTSGVFNGVTYSAGMRFSGTAALLGASLSVSMATVPVVVSAIPVTDFQLSIVLHLPTFQAALTSAIDSLLPISITLPSQLNLANTFSLTTVSLTGFSLVGIAQGNFPTLSATVVVAGTQHTLSVQLQLSGLTQSPQQLLLQAGLHRVLPQCIVNSHCSGSQVCDHRSWPWSCISSCPFPCGSLIIPAVGCFDGIPCPPLPHVGLPF
eukprot:TRINITY_DN1376_c0_g1_i1.p1 TRINITY_DN1376_c0_g1~~TRINITY_DN1376_c0_g1_i1.p1  ORF type:complete len:1063 (+),score=222.35 TRINITY_DN1376_c0_g1_i1:86-3274(+)